MPERQAAELERVLLSLRKLRAFMGLIVDKLDLDPEATIAEFSAEGGPDGKRLVAEVTLQECLDEADMLLGDNGDA
jgi:hypothetical protein